MKNTTYYTKELYKAFNRYHFRSLLNPKKRIFQVILVIVVAVYAYLFKHSLGLFIVFLTMDLIFIILYFTNVISDYQTNKIYKKYKQFFDVKHQFKFNDKNFEVKVPDFSEKYRYDKLIKVVSTLDYYYLYTSNTSAFIIEKRGFDNLESVDKILSELKVYESEVI